MAQKPHFSPVNEALHSTVNPADLLATRVHLVDLGSYRTVTVSLQTHPEFETREAQEQATALAAHKTRLAASQIVQKSAEISSPVAENEPAPLSSQQQSLAPNVSNALERFAARATTETSDSEQLRQEAYDKIDEARRAA